MRSLTRMLRLMDAGSRRGNCESCREELMAREANKRGNLCKGKALHRKTEWLYLERPRANPYVRIAGDQLEPGRRRIADARRAAERSRRTRSALRPLRGHPESRDGADRGQ